VRELFDPEVLRAMGRRVAFARRVDRPTLVLGSTQPAGLVDEVALQDAGIELVRRRSGGGAVLLEPERCVWMDTWVPRADPLWHDDVARSRTWIGEWWTAAIGSPELRVHTGPPVSSAWSDLLCFAGIDAGEVVAVGRKVVGVAQWRSRQGALTHSMAYLDADWTRLAHLLLPEPDATGAALELARSTARVTEFMDTTADALASALSTALPDAADWELRVG
jgi:lipoate-protein ligase A